MLNRTILILGLLFTTLSINATTVDVYFSQNTIQSLNPSSFSISILGNYTGPETLAGGAFNLNFNEQLLQLQNVSIDASTADFSSNEGVIDKNKGTLTGVGFSNFWGLRDEFKIADLTFDIISNGSSTLELSNALDPIFLWQNYDYSVSQFGDSVTPVFTNATVQPVPLPGASLLFISAIFSLVIKTKKVSV